MSGPTARSHTRSRKNAKRKARIAAIKAREKALRKAGKT